ncbi:MAG: TetR/AcrR family transcriptional regulator [Halomonadaceae bacterium]|nr:MAG: TetR/AcrR family transcriptional regulator [Halomonadaceae bacterium]
MNTARSGKRERKRAANRAAILNAARDCFRDLGYERSTIRDIVGRTDLAAGTFYNYFDDKRDLFASLLRDFMDDLNQRLGQLRETSPDEQTFVYQTYLALFLATARDPLIYELAHRNQRAMRQLFGGGLLGQAMTTLREDLSAASERGLFSGMNGDYLAAAFFGVAYELSLQVAGKASGASDIKAQQVAEEAAAFATDLFIGGTGRLRDSVAASP